MLKIAGTSAVGAVGLGATGSTTTIAASSTDEFEVEKVEADPNAGFNYPYFIYGPPIDDEQERPIFVSPDFRVKPDDDIQVHVDAAEEWISGTGRYIANELEVPVVVPVVPWYENDPLDATHAAPTLDAETMGLSDTDLERFDEQLVAVIEDATSRLTDEWHPVAEGILLDGLHVTGLFVNRFAALHPERVRSVSAGGFSGTAILPEESIDDTTLNYPIGVANFDKLVDEEFDLSGFADVDQFIYQGEESDMDLVGDYRVWNKDQADIVNDVYGNDLQARFEYSEKAYDDADLTAQFKLYEDANHGDIRNMADEDLLAHHRPHVGVTSLDVTQRPDAGAESVEVRAFVTADYEEGLELRAFRSDRVDLTESVVAVDSGKQVETEIGLTEPLQAGEHVFVVALEPSEEDPEKAIVSDGAWVDETYVAFRQQPAGGDEHVDVLAVTSTEDSREYEGLEIRVGDESKQELTDEPIGVGRAYGGGVQLVEELSEGDELTVVIQTPGDYNPDEALVSDTATVAAESTLTAAFTYSPESPDVETEVTFDASDSEPTEQIEEYFWDFTGDESPDRQGKQVTYTFEEPGDHEVLLVVEDAEGNVDMTTQTVNVREGCFIATAACGTPDHQQVETLREFRDTTLKGNPVGELLVQLYYATSPPVADWIAKSERRRSLVRSAVVRPAARLTSTLGLDGTERRE